MIFILFIKTLQNSTETKGTVISDGKKKIKVRE